MPRTTQNRNGAQNAPSALATRILAWCHRPVAVPTTEPTGAALAERLHGEQLHTVPPGRPDAACRQRASAAARLAEQLPTAHRAA